MIIGIDPGAKGAIAERFVDNAGYIHDMPMLGKEVNGAALAEIFEGANHIYIEQVNSFGMGRTSAFNFGQGMGVIKGVIATMKIPYTMVTPMKWKKHFGLNRDKDASRLLATRLFPNLADQFKRKKDDGRAEAALIALYGEKELDGRI